MGGLISAMPTVGAIIERLLPRGANRIGGRRRRRDQCPRWPPDAFAVTALIVNQSAIYCRPRYVTRCRSGFLFDDHAIHEHIKHVANQWSEFQHIPTGELDELWRRILAGASQPLTGLDPDCADACLTLMMIADSASAGVGFVVNRDRSRIADYLLEEHRRLVSGDVAYLLPYVPYSLCRMVPPDEVCVQPKTITAQVGCTLRSLSHHLALLPPITEVETQWMLASSGTVETVDRALNLLLVPFPFHIDGNCFVAGEYCFGMAEGNKPNKALGRFFRIDQDWLRFRNRRLSAQTVGKFLLDLVKEAENEVEELNGIILPELALDRELARPVANMLARGGTNLELFICGVASSGVEADRNYAQTFLFKSRRTNGSSKKTAAIFTYWSQSKHHRWQLDARQIQRYSLGDQLEPEGSWWELADIDRRRCVFYAFRGGMSLATLICEDLARIDPVQSVIRAVGPNLVVALLMDGPQTEKRWSARYATVLADDPGSAVLTLTSLGLMRRSVRPGAAEPRQIALWKGADGIAQELSLPSGHQALLLTLTSRETTNYTMDSRSDDGATYQLSLSGVRAVRLRRPPDWLRSN